MNHHSAPVEVREQIAILESDHAAFCGRLTRSCGLTGLVALSTCNRVELYGVSRSENLPVADISAHLVSGARDISGISPHLFLKEGRAAIEHLFEVASGLDSMVLGETEILGQVKDAYEKSAHSGHTDKIINRIFQKAFHAAKQVRSQTGITRGNVSVSSVAVTLAEKIFGSIDSLHVMIIGAGEMSGKTARAFIAKGVSSVSIVNRSLEKAEQMARDLGVGAHVLDEWTQKALEADIIVSSTSAPELLIHRQDIERLMEARHHRPLFLIDLAVPRDIDPAINWIDDCYLYNIDDLQSISQDASERRSREIEECRRIIVGKAETLARWMKMNTTDSAQAK
ncbi:glutamyl-tRNA reductase [Oscillatoria amoena NRMC-F 0135]|nr:glutamyl-tRNA reductase [Oscillatoria amoena NRMC-F 0135]